MYYRANNSTVCVKTCGLQMSLSKRTIITMPNDCNFEVKDRVICNVCKMNDLTFIDSMAIGY